MRTRTTRTGRSRRLARAAQNRRGAVMLVVLALVLMVSTLGLVMMRMSLSFTDRQGLANDGKQAFYIAESGLAEAYWGLRHGHAGQVGTVGDPVYFGGGLFWVDAYPQGDDVMVLESTGMHGRGRVSLSLSVRATATANEGSGRGLFSQNSLSVAPGVTIDGFDSNAGTYEEQLDATGAPTLGGSLASNGDVHLGGTAENPVRVIGDVTAGPDAGVTMGEQDVVTGDVSNLPEPVTLDPVEVPTYSQFPASRSVSSDPVVLSGGEYEYDTLTVQDGGLLVLRGPLDLVVDDLSVLSGAELMIDNAGGTVNLYARTSVDLAAGSAVSTTGTDPWALRLRSAGTGSEGGVRLNGSGSLHGIFEAPASGVALGATLELFGALSGQDVALAEGATLHVDVSTLHGAVSDVGMWSPEVLLWAIVSLPQEAAPSGDPFRVMGVDKDAIGTPYQSHRDLWLAVDYLDVADNPQTWMGYTSDVDPTMLRQVQEVRAYTSPLAFAPIYVRTIRYRVTSSGDTVAGAGSNR